MPQFEHDRASVHYDSAGQGSPLLLIAGTASDGGSWGPLLPLLRGRRLVLMDNRGSGRTKVDGPIEIAEMVEDAAALLDHLELESVDVVGHSLGGFIALLLAVRHPGRVSRLVTMGTGPMSAASKVLLHDLARLYFTMVPQDWFRIFYQFLFSDPFFADEARVAQAAEASTRYPFRQSPGDFGRQIAALDRIEPVDLSVVACPTLAIAGELDVLARPEAVRAMHAPIKGCRQMTLAGVAHSIHWEKPHESAAVIKAFLD
jgi:pimeloyl-ACP methyl ester carboxylesterase